MRPLLLKLVLSITFLMIVSTEISTADDRKKELLICSAYHLKEKLNNQYSSEEIYLYHDTYFNNLQKSFLRVFQKPRHLGSFSQLLASWSLGHTLHKKRLELLK